ncbi:MAG: hypothetical protein NZL87_05065 [Thermomicrobium sp.]|nr:hypothetical protein [Thermomicrobium sp.]
MQRRGLSPFAIVGMLLGLTVLCVAGIAVGGVAGFLAARWRAEATPSPTLPPTAADVIAVRSPTLAPPSPTTVVPPTATPTPYTITGWIEYRDEGFLRLQYPPGWRLAATLDDPTTGRPSCHCYWILTNDPSAPDRLDGTAVARQFGTRSIGDLPPNTVWIEILRADAVPAARLDLRQPIGSRFVGSTYEAELYSLYAPGGHYVYRYRDEIGRHWVIVLIIRADGDTFDALEEEAYRVLQTVRHW